MSDRLAESIRAIIRNEFPQLDYLGSWEYAVQSTDGRTCDLSPTASGVPLPDLTAIPIRCVVAGSPVIGARCLVTFANGDSTRPIVTWIDSGTEHLTTIEAMSVLLYNTFVAVATSNAALWVGSVIRTTVGAAINSALGILATPAPAGKVAQEALAAAQAATVIVGTPIQTSLPFGAGIAAVNEKTQDVSGLFPSVGIPWIS